MPRSEVMQSIVESPLYLEIEIDESIQTVIAAHLDETSYNALSIDLFCTECKENSVFYPIHNDQINTKGRPNSFCFYKDIVPNVIIEYACARDSRHSFYMYLLKTGTKIIKIGQYPSKADLELTNLNQYLQVIPKEKLADLKMATGLASHGVGAGSFVYLRRVFEYLIEQAYIKAENDKIISKEDYLKARVGERIDLLKDYLPDSMHKNKQFYGIISKGVHELSEKECKDNFELMKCTIEIILDELLENKKRFLKKQEINAQIQKLHNQYK